MARTVLLYKLKQVLLFGTLLCATFGVAFSVSAAERVERFEVDITLQADGSISVVEEIQYDFGTDQRHGIFRELSTSHNQPASAWYKNRSVTYEIISVERNNSPEPFIQTGGSLLNLKVGDADTKITGLQSYTLSYVVRGAVSQFDDGSTELYWNVTGGNWSVPMDNVSIELRTTADAQLLSQAVCYRGCGGS